MKRDEGMKWVGDGGWLERKKQEEGGREVLWWSLATGRFRHVSAMLVDGSVFGVEHPRASHIQQVCSCCGRGLRLEPKRLAAGLEHKLMVLHMNFVERKAWRMWGLG